MYQLTQNQISSKLNKQTAILNFQAGHYYGLNEVGTQIWGRLEESPADFDELKALIIEKFDVDAESCEIDLREILNDLIDAGLIEKIK